MGQKSPDWFGVYGCSSCHDVIDGRQGALDETLPPEEILKLSRDALFRTWERMIDKGLIKI